MAQSQESIIREFKAHISSRGGGYSAWYVGITAEPKRRVSGEHCVDLDLDKYIWIRANSAESSRAVEAYFLALGCDGGPGGGNDGADVVYAYKKSSRTDP